MILKTNYLFHLAVTSNNNSVHITRLLKLMEMTGLEIAGFSEITKVSESHLYALLNGTKRLTTKTANKIAFPFKLTGAQILNLDYNIPETIKSAPQLVTFKKDYANNPEYFLETKIDRKDSYFFEEKLIKSDLFSESVSVSAVKKACTEYNRHYSSKEISQNLGYLVTTGELETKKIKITKKNGEVGEREIRVYYLKKGS